MLLLCAMIALSLFFTLLVFAAPSPQSAPSPQAAVASPSVRTLLPITTKTTPDQWEFLLDPDRDYVGTLVNLDNPYDFEGDYARMLVTDLTYLPDEVYLDTACAEQAAAFAFSLLRVRLKQQGIDIGLLGSTAGYRTAEDQDWIYSITEDQVKVTAGYSEHHTGLVLSIVFLAADENGEIVWQTPTADHFQTAHPDLIEALLEELPECGFIVRYPEGKEGITGISATYRDIRFVGDSDVARFIQLNDLCLEEYLDIAQ